MTAFLFSCENATCAVPEAYREIFRGSEDALTSTEGWEPGSLNLAQAFSMRFRTPLVHGDVTRLLIDLEQDGDARWSRFSSKLPEATRGKVTDRHEKPYRTQLDQRIAEDLRRHKAVLHVMVHTSPDSHGHIELETPANADLAEKIATSWKSQLQNASDLDVRHHRNGTHQAHAAALARIHPPDQYAQIRLTVAQSFFLEGKPWRWETLKKLLLDTLAPAVSEATGVSAP
jgi:predicted N-formylglutamate amidohydrolase